MNKVGIIGVVLGGIILGIWGVLSLEIFSITEDNDVSSDPILGKEGGDSRPEKPPGRDLSIELNEKMGLSAP